jgi:UTP--glucose-1-phosphate uridylyltransferase
VSRNLQAAWTLAALHLHDAALDDVVHISVTDLIEKPNFENAPSNLASIGRYILTPNIFDILRNQSIGVGGEIQLADSLKKQAENNRVETVPLNGKRFDCGDRQGYVEAIKHIASNYKFD